MKISLKIWLTAQILNGIINLIYFQYIGIWATIFAAIGGIPAILIYRIWFGAIEKTSFNGWKKTILSLMVCSCTTALCAYTVIIALTGFNNYLHMFALIPAIATAISVLINYCRRNTNNKEKNDEKDNAAI